MESKRESKLGLGLWKVPKEQCAQVVYDAIQLGYRYLDCACDYGNEKEVGEGLARVFSEGICTRDELFIASKLWNTYHHSEHVEPALSRTLGDLGIDYLDSYLIHFPIAQEFVPFETRYPPEWFFHPDATSPHMQLAPVPLHKTWSAMEVLVHRGLAKSIGVCNYNSGLLRDLMAYATIKPADLQIEVHPYLTQEKLIRLAQSYGIEVTAFSPLGAASYMELAMASSDESVLLEPALIETAQRHGKTPAQVALRWGLQRGCSVVTKSSKTERLKENLQLFDFELSNDEMAEIAALNRNRRFNDPGVFCASAFNTQCPIYD
ncbi:MAG: aldo/keto reductase [Pseudomonadota bacterium]